jgi:hypothetical protein
MNKIPWMASGALKDGLLLFGPLKERPKDDMGPMVEVSIQGVPYYVVCCCKEATQAQKLEIQEWAEKAIVAAKKSP